MKLFYIPGSSSLASHIALREAAVAFELERVDHATRQTARGVDLRAIHPKGYVPVLQLDDGETLTEGSVIVQYVADLSPDKALAPPAGTMDRVRLQEWLAFMSAELQKCLGPLFNASIPAAGRERATARAFGHLTVVDDRLARRQYLVGESFTVADATLYVMSSWVRRLGLDLTRFPAVTCHFHRIDERAAVRAALAAEAAA